MTDDQLEIQRLRGELAIAREELSMLRDSQETHGRDVDALTWWAEEMLFWRSKYLNEHPEHANKEYVRSARENERIDVKIFP
jgi:hypothetical protein